MKNTSAKRCTRQPATAGWLLLACLTLAPAAVQGGNDGEADATIRQCVADCDQAHVVFSEGLAGPGSDQRGAKNMARMRYNLCLYHCDPLLSLHGTLMRLFPPVGRLSEIKRSALSTADQLLLCEQDCSNSRRLCVEAQFENADLCEFGARACSERCDDAFGGVEGPGTE